MTRKDAAARFMEDLPKRLSQRGITGCVMDVQPVHEDDDVQFDGEGDVVWIDQVTSPAPRRGTGRAMLAEACMLADELDCSLALNPWAQASVHPDALRQDELERFYMSLGFGWRRDHVMVRRPWVQTVVDVRHDVPYLPLPNRVELVLSGTHAPTALTRTAFAVPVMDDGTVVMAHNRRRGMEVPGGHIDPGESQETAAKREAREEAGAQLGDLVALGHLRLTSQGEVPSGWRYPHPLSYQQFFAARVQALDPYVANDECHEPIVVRDDQLLKPHVRIMAQRARILLSNDQRGDAK